MLYRLLDWFEEHKVGVIGTLALHSFALFAFTLWTLRETPTEEEISDMRIEVLSEEELEQLMTEAPTADGTPQQVTNLTSNITAALRPNFSQAKLQERVEEELRAMEQEEFDRLAKERTERGEDVEMPQLDPSKWNKELYMDKAAEPVKVEGATTVWHDLKGRVRADDVPGYLCKEEGRVAVAVHVGRDGRVQKAEIKPSETTTVNACMLEHALSSARRARFDTNAQAADPQKGTVYFLFLRQ
jgi:outer membrane biosynthesis protein TonB